MSSLVDLEGAADGLTSVLAEVLSAVLREEVVAAGQDTPSGPLAVARLAIHDQSGDVHAVVKVNVPVELATLITARMMAVPAPSPDDIVDAVAEFGNMVGGSVKALLCHHARLSLPTAQLARPVDEVSVPPTRPGGDVRARVLGHVAQLLVVPGGAIDGLFWPPSILEEILERSA